MTPAASRRLEPAPEPAWPAAGRAGVRRAPHPLQTGALSAVTSALGGSDRTDRRGLVVMPCGAGKTLLGRWVAEDLAASLTVVFVPSIGLLAQTLTEWRSDPSWPHDAMIVCSDPSSGRAVAVEDLEVPEWARRAVTASTSTDAIAGFLRTRTARPRVLLSTYHSAPRLAEAVRQVGRLVDLVVSDEAHRLTGMPRSEFREVLDNRLLPARRRLSLTATPVEASVWTATTGPRLGPQPTLSIRDETLFGPALYEASFADAIACGRLVDYDVQVLARTEDHPGGPGGRVDLGAAATLTAARGGAGRILTFHSRVSHARQLAESLDGRRLPDGRRIRARHIEASTPAVVRAAVLRHLRAHDSRTVHVVASARTLTEGIDIPAVDTVVFADPKTSPVDTVQAVGRAMRSADGKTRGLVILPVALPPGQLDPDSALSGTTWARTWAVLRALATMDPRFARTLRRPPTTRTVPAAGPRPAEPGPRLLTDLPADLDVEGWRLRALDRTGQGWWANLEALRRWAGREGHAHPSPAAVQDGMPVGRWVGRQRRAHAADELDPDRIAALERLPEWSWNRQEIAWWRGWRGWVAAVPATGAASTEEALWSRLTALPVDLPAGAPPGRHDHTTLASFAAATLADQRRGALPARLAHAVELLPAWPAPLPPQEEVLVDALEEYAAWKDDFNVPHDYRHDSGLELGAWLTALRRRAVTGRLHPLLAAELEAAQQRLPSATPIAWSVDATRWRLGLLALVAYRDREGTVRVPVGHREQLPDHTVDLAAWCATQRSRYRGRDLAAWQVAALEQVHGWRWELVHRPGSTGEAVATGQDLVPAAGVRGHLRILLGRGATQLAICRAAKVDRGTVAAIVDGRQDRVRPDVADALAELTLASIAAAADETFVDAAETWRLIDDLLALGWPKTWIGRELGTTGALRLRRTKVPRAVAAAAADLHRRVDGRRPPPRRPSTRTPPLAAMLAGTDHPAAGTEVDT